MRTSEAQSPILGLILREHPDYATNRHRFVSGDVVTCSRSSALCYVVESAIEYCTCIVLRPGFGMPKGLSLRVAYSDLEYFEYGEYQRPPYKVSKSIYWEAGDIVRDRGTLFLVKERPKESPTYVYAIALESENPYVHIGECFALPDPYWSYHQGTRNNRGKIGRVLPKDSHAP